MEKLHAFFVKYRALLLLLLLALVSLAALGWGWYTTAAAANDQPFYQIVNDDYDEILAPADPRQGFLQQIVVEKDTPLYGVRLNFATYNKVLHGTLHADILMEDGSVAASAVSDMTEILDNTFMGLVFDRMLPAGPEAVYTLHVYTEPASPEDVLGLWVGAARPGFALTDPADPANTGHSAAIQYMVDYTGSVVSRAYWVPALLLALGVLAGGWLILHKAKVQTVFCVSAALIGVAFSLITPPLAAPDEYAHVAASYAMASELSGQPSYNEDGQLLMRPCDAPHMTWVTGDVGPFVYKRVAEHLLDGGNANTPTVPVRVSAPYSPVHPLYAAQTLGILLARVTGLGFFGMVWLGRLANLAVYLLLGGLALRLMPFAKDLLFCVAMLPMSLQLAASFSPDTMVLGICFALTALALRCSAQKEKLRPGQLAGLLVLCAAIGPCKAIYVVLVALCWMIPKEKFAAVKQAWLFRAASVAAALAGWLLYNYEAVAYQFRDVTLSGLPILLAVAALAGFGLWKAVKRWGHSKAFRRGVCIVIVLAVVAAGALAAFGLLHVGGTLTPEQLAESIQPNGESIYTFSVGYLLRHIPTAVRLLVNTVTEDAPLILQELLGTRLSEPIVYEVEASWIYSVGLVLVLLAAALRTAGEQRRLPGYRIWVVGGIFAVTALLVVGACFTWTPINMQHLFGLQGRYLLPVLPMLLLCLGENSAFVKTRLCEGGIRFAGIALAALVALQGLGLYAAM